MVSFPRLCAETGGFHPAYDVTTPFLAQLIFAFRICMADVPLVLSTREPAWFRDGMAGVGINRMSIESRTTVGGYAHPPREAPGQFEISDARSMATFCTDLRRANLEPVLKNWDAVFQRRDA
jgi:2-iminoacetate synthase